MSRTLRLGLSEAQGHGKIFSFFSPQRALPCLPLLLHLGPHVPRWGWPLLLLCWTCHKASLGQVGGFLIGHSGSLSLTSCSRMRSVGCRRRPSRASPCLGATRCRRWGASLPAVTQRSENSENQRKENVHGGVTECVYVQKARPFKR